jgi:hypothetical protein
MTDTVTERSKQGFAVPRLLGLKVRIPPGYVGLSLVSVVYCLCDGPITCPEQSYQPWYVTVFDLRSLKNESGGGGGDHCGNN